MYSDRITGLRVEQQTDQNYFRLYLGWQVGGHGNAFLRPHAGLNVALDGGVKYIKRLSVPQQPGEGSVYIYPQYFQTYIGVGASFDMLGQ